MLARHQNRRTLVAHASPTSLPARAIQNLVAAATRCRPILRIGAKSQDRRLIDAVLSQSRERRCRNATHVEGVSLQSQPLPLTLCAHETKRPWPVWIAGSSNGRTADSGSAYLGSNPSPAAIPIADGRTKIFSIQVIENQICNLQPPVCNRKDGVGGSGRHPKAHKPMTFTGSHRPQFGKASLHFGMTSGMLTRKQTPL